MPKKEVSSATTNKYSFSYPNRAELTEAEREYKATLHRIAKRESVPAAEMHSVFAEHLRQRYGDKVAQNYLKLVNSPDYRKIPLQKNAGVRRHHTAKVLTAF